MADSRQRTILECGFAPPSVAFVKQDPRGQEYGYFEAVVPADPSVRSIRVYKRSQSGPLEWACTFDDQISFGRWAKDNT